MIRVALIGFDPSFQDELEAMFGGSLNTARLQFVRERPYTHVVLATHAMLPAEDMARIPPKNVLHLCMEPHAFLRLTPALTAHLNTRTARTLIGLPHPALIHSMAGFVPIPSQGFLHLPPPPAAPPAAPRISLPLSNKRMTAGQAYRHTLATALLRHPARLPVDVWGRGALALGQRLGLAGDPRIRGPFANCEPFDPAVYTHTVAIENCVEGMYFSEKVSLPLYCGCVPLYLGTKHIERFFPKATLALTGRVDDDVRMIVDLCAGKRSTVAPDLAAAKASFQARWHFGRYLERHFLAARDQT